MSDKKLLLAKAALSFQKFPLFQRLTGFANCPTVIGQ